MKGKGRQADEASGGGCSDGTDPAYWRRVGEERFLVAPADRGGLVAVMSEHFPSVMTERVADGREVLETVIHRTGGAPRAAGEWPTGRELFALGEAYWYTEDDRFAAGVTMLLRRWGADAALADGAGADSLWTRCSRLLGWLAATVCILPYRGFDEAVAPSLLRGFVRETEVIDDALRAGGLAPRERAAGLTTLAIADLLAPELFAASGRLERSLGELALETGQYLGLDQGSVPAILDGLEFYVPLLALSLRLGLEVPGRVLQDVDAALDVLAGPPFPGPARARSIASGGGVALLPMVPAGPARRMTLVQGAAHVLGREDLLEDPGDGAAGLLFLVGSECVAAGTLVPAGAP